MNADLATLEHRLREADSGTLTRLETRYRRAVRRRDSDAAAWFALGRIALSRGDPSRAEEALRRALELDLREPAFLLALAEVMLLRGRFVEAEPLLQAAAGSRPADPAIQFHLARAWMGQGRLGAAETALRRALALAPEAAEIRAELGHLLARRGRLEEARRCLEAVLAADPDPGTRLTVLEYLSRLGDRAAVVDAYRRHLESHPGDVRARYNLAFKAAGEISEGEHEMLRRSLASDDLSPRQRAAVHYALAGLAEAGGDMADAWEHAAAAGRAMVAELESRDAQYDPDAHRRRVSRIIEVFGPGWFRRSRDRGEDTRLPVFIVGLPRSGTTLVEQILASHREVSGAGELALINLSLERLPLLMQDCDDPLDCAAAADATVVAQSRRFCLEAYGDLAAGAHRVTDKFPDNYLHLGWIRTLFPRATIVHCVRDPRDSALSCWLNRLPELHWSCDLEHITRRVEDYRRVMSHWESVLPGGMFHLSYETLVTEPEREVRRLVAACGLDWDPACLRFHETARAVETASHSQVRRPVYDTACARWRRYENELQPYLKRLAG